MIFKVILFFLATPISTLYPMARHTYSPAFLQEPRSENNEGPKRFFDIQHTDNTASTVRVLELLRSVTPKNFNQSTTTSTTNATTANTTISTTTSSTTPTTATQAPKNKLKLIDIKLNLSKPLNKLVVFESGKPLIENIKNSQAAIRQLAYVLELTEILIKNDQLQNLYLYLNELTATFKNVSVILKNLSPEEIVAYYIEDCYAPITQKSVTSWLNKTPQLKFNDAVMEILTPKNNDASLQLIEILEKLFLTWQYYAQLFSNNDFNALVSMSHPNAQLSIQAWRDITYKIAKDLYGTTEEGKEAIKQQQKEEAEIKVQELERAKRQKEVDDFNAYQEKVLKELETSRQEAFKKHAQATSELMLSATQPMVESSHLKNYTEYENDTEKLLESSIKATTINNLKEQEIDLQVLENTTTITEERITFVNDELDIAIKALKMISIEKMEDVDQAVLTSLVAAYEWLEEPRKEFSDEPSQDFFDNKFGPKTYNDSYLHLKYEFNKRNLDTELKYILQKMVYVWNYYCSIFYTGEFKTEVTLKFSALNTPKKSISDWIKFTSNAGFSYAGQFKNILKKEPPKFFLQRFFAGLRPPSLWKSKKRPATAEEIATRDAFFKEQEATRETLKKQEDASFEKIKNLMVANREKLGKTSNTQAVNPAIPKSTTAASEAKATTAPTSVTKPSKYRFNAELAAQLAGRA